MVKIKTKLTAILMTLCCACACLGVVTFVRNNKSLVASAASTYTVNKLGVLGDSTATAIYAQVTDGDSLGVNSWDHKFVFQSGTGDGVKYNGVDYPELVMKQPGADLFLELIGKTAQNGDELLLDGTFTHETAGSIVISNCGFKYNDGTWSAFTYHNIGELTLHVNSSVGGASGQNNVLYLQRNDGGELPIKSWDYVFAADDASYFLKNDAPTALGESKSTGDGFYWVFEPANEGDVITIEGSFFCESQNVRYYISQSNFKWTGSSWKKDVNYTKHTISNLEPTWPSSSADDASNAQIYLKINGVTGLPVQTWDYFFNLKSGDGLKVNGVSRAIGEMKSAPEGLFLTFSEVSAGDVVSLSGTFVSDTLGVKYIIKESIFEYNGSYWIPYVDYDDVQLGKIQFSHGNAQQLYFKPVDTTITLPINSWDYPFSYVSGAGITLNGEMISFTNSVKSPDGTFFVDLGTSAKAGDVVKVGGTFRCTNKELDYVIENCMFQYNGTTWVVDYEDYNVGKLKYSEGTKQIYFKPVDGRVLPVSSWDYAFSYVSGTGITLNDTMISFENRVKSLGESFFVDLGKDPKAGDVLKIGGTLRSIDKEIDYVFEDVAFEFNGTSWVNYVKYNSYNVGKLVATGDSDAGALHLAKESGSFEVVESTWTEKLAFLEGSGVGVTFNGTQIVMDDIKIPGNLYVNIKNTAKAGDVVVIQGTFYNETLAVKYVIAENKLQYDGSKWVEYEEPAEMATYNVSDLISTNDSNASQLYLAKENGSAFEVTDPSWNKTLTFEIGSGIGVTFNGTQIVMDDIKIPGTLFVNTKNTAKVGDVVAIQGAFYNTVLNVKYVIPLHQFTYNGSKWVRTYSDDLLAVYDVVTPVDIGYGLSKEMSGKGIDNSGLSYVKSNANTTGSIKFRFGYNSNDIANDNITIRLRGAAWEGVKILLAWEGLYVSPVENGSATEWYKGFKNNTDYVVELGAIDLKDGSATWIYVAVNDAIITSKKVALSTYNNNHVSVYADSINATITDPDHVLVTYINELGEFTDYAEKGKDYTLTSAKSYHAFIGWVVNNVIYDAGDTITEPEEDFTVKALTVDFSLEEGAAIRLSSSANTAGLRFTGLFKQDELNELQGLVKELSYGILIMPYDKLEAGQEPNLEDFVAGESIIKLVSDPNKSAVEGGYVKVWGAMTNLYSSNYERLFAGRGYIEVTFNNGETKIFYTHFDKEDNVRSVRAVAQRFQDDTVEYNKISAEVKAVVDTYAKRGEINLMKYEAYAKNNTFNLTAWYYPELTISEGADNIYNNDTNIAIAKKLTDAGIEVIYLDGKYHLDLNNAGNVEKTRQMIEFFWSQGLKTIAFGSNASVNCPIDYSTKDFPDFSDCEGFMGFLVWDEPQPASMKTLGQFAENFNKTYAGSDAIFMTNLLPSYASIFNGTSNWWESSTSSLKKNDFKAYLQSYNDNVLTKVKGEKWLSLDTYPIRKDKSLTPNFLFDLAMLKYYSLAFDATSHAVLQSSGWRDVNEKGEVTNDTMYRMPTEAELRMQAYTAMAFGIDSISWWSYSDMRGDNQLNPTDTGVDYYTRFANVNKELASIDHIYKAFDWKGVILGVGKNNGGTFTKDNDYEAYNLVRGEIGDYEITSSNITTKTQHLASIPTLNSTNYNYIMGVMEDMNGNEGYVVCNYNTHSVTTKQRVTITFDSNVTEVIIYRGGVAETVGVTNKSLTVDLAVGEGVIILPSKLG